MKKQMIIMLMSVGLLFGLIFGWKIFSQAMTKQYLATMQAPAQTVSAMRVEASLWQPNLKAVGSLRAKIGVNVTTELAGMVQTIYFKPGTHIKKGTVLVQLNAATELGQLHALEAQVELAKITYRRDKAQYAVHAVSKQTVDTDLWNLKKLQAQAEQQRATVAKKTIKAPFSGHLGINLINPGQYLNVGNTVTTLQSWNPIYIDFFLPQQSIGQLKMGQKVKVVTDAFPQKIFEGKITTIQPAIDVDNRNVQVEATIVNPKSALKPGMFAHAEVDVGMPKTFLTLPQSAISYNPYGDLVYLINDTGKKDKQNRPILVANQVFVTVGETRGDQVAILKGLKRGDWVVTSGQLKLKNGTQVFINNAIQPSNNVAPVIKER